LDTAKGCVNLNCNSDYITRFGWCQWIFGGFNGKCTLCVLLHKKRQAHICNFDKIRVSTIIGEKIEPEAIAGTGSHRRNRKPSQEPEAIAGTGSHRRNRKPQKRQSEKTPHLQTEPPERYHPRFTLAVRIFARLPGVVHSLPISDPHPLLPHKPLFYLHPRHRNCRQPAFYKVPHKLPFIKYILGTPNTI